MKRISVIIPLYNNMWYIETAINSCLDQVIDDDTDIEIIIVDDCSSDNSLQTVESMFSHYKNIKVIKNDANHGISYSRNKGISAARGRYIYFLDSDDFIHKRTLVTLSNIIESLDSRFIGVKTDYIYVDDDDKRSEKISSEDLPIACGILFKKSMLINLGGYNVNLQSFEELDLFERIDSSGKLIAHVPVAFYRYRMHQHNHTKSIDVATEYNRYMDRK